MKHKFDKFKKDFAWPGKIPYFKTIKITAKCVVEVEADIDEKAAEAAAQEEFDRWVKGLEFPSELSVSGQPQVAPGSCHIAFSGKIGTTHLEFHVELKDIVHAHVQPLKVKFPTFKAAAGKLNFTVSPELDITPEPDVKAIAKLIYDKCGGDKIMEKWLGKSFVEILEKAGWKVGAGEVTGAIGDLAGPLVAAAVMGYEALFTTLSYAIPAMVSEAVEAADIKAAKEMIGQQTRHCFRGFQFGLLGLNLMTGDNQQAYKMGHDKRAVFLADLKKKYPDATDEQISKALGNNSKVHQFEDQVYNRILEKVRQAVWSDYVKKRKSDWEKCSEVDRTHIWMAIWKDPPGNDPRFVNFTP